nr:PREDICTED: uncharacterized protein LOC109039931 [Bemisia tabaci]
MADNPNQDVQAREAAVVQNPEQEAPQPHGQRHPAQDNPDGPPRQRARPNPRQPPPYRQVDLSRQTVFTSKQTLAFLKVRSWAHISGISVTTRSLTLRQKSLLKSMRTLMTLQY